ncbi:hypothetical protein [Kibdelosporangium aridum]|nr:hypothetical protein [Kibdelosporangium aridum]
MDNTFSSAALRAQACRAIMEFFTVAAVIVALSDHRRATPRT